MLGLGWGFVALSVAASITVALGARALDLDHPPERWLKHFKNAAMSATFVALLEELLFRGALFGTLRRTHSFWSAALISSSLYALLHFLERPGNRNTSAPRLDRIEVRH